MSLTVLRAAIIIGSGSASFEIIRDLVEKLPVMIAPKWLKSRCQPIAVSNVLEYLIGDKILPYQYLDIRPTTLLQPPWWIDAHWQDLGFLSAHDSPPKNKMRDYRLVDSPQWRDE